MQIELYQLKNIIMTASRLGATMVLTEMNPASDNLSQREAWKLYGRSRVEKWVEQGLLKPRREGASANCKKYFSRTDLIAVDNAEKISSTFEYNEN